MESGPDGFDGQIQIGPPIGWNPDVPYGTRMCRMEPGCAVWNPDISDARNESFLDGKDILELWA